MTALMFIGSLILFVTGIWLLVVAFKTSVWWGLGSLIVPFVSLIFVFVHWQDAKKPFLWGLVGLAMVVVAVMVQPELWGVLT